MFIKRYKRITVIIMIAVLVIGLTTAFAATGVINISGGVQAIRQTEKNTTEKVLVTINGKYTITQKDIDSSKELNSMANDLNKKMIENNTSLSKEEKEKALKQIAVLSDEELVQQFIKTKVLICEAERLGITVSDDEVLKDLDKNMDIIKEMSNNITDPEGMSQAKNTLAIYESFLKGMNMTHEVCQKEYQLPVMKEKMMIAKLYKKFTDTLPQSKNEDSNTVEKKYEDYVAELMENAKIEKIQ